MAGLCFQHYVDMGGIDYLANRAAERSGVIYDLIDSSGGFYCNEVSLNLPLSKALTLLR